MEAAGECTKRQEETDRKCQQAPVVRRPQGPIWLKSRSPKVVNTIKDFTNGIKDLQFEKLEDALDRSQFHLKQ